MRALRTLVVVAITVLVFVGGLVAGLELERAATSSGARAQGALYQQVLTDLQRDYYKPVNVAKLGQTGVTALLASLHDPYTVYFTPQEAKQFSQELSGTYSGIGTAVEMKGGQLTVTKVFAGSPAAQAGIRAGDVIVSVNGVPAAGKSVTATVARIVGPASTTVHLQLLRHGASAPIQLTLTRRSISEPLTSARLLNDHGVKVGYVDLSAFANGAGKQVEQAIAGLRQRGARWLVFDLRDNGGGLVNEAVGVASDFLPAGKVVVSTQGLHSHKDVLKTTRGPATSLPLVVLVNGNTASASEIVTGALQDYRRATIIGTKTFGKGVVQTILPLPGGASLKITIASYLTPLGRSINHRGIEPTIVAAQPKGATADKVLARALRFIVNGH